MPRYFFHLRCASEGANDPSGEEFANDTAPRDHVVASIREMIEGGLRSNAGCLSFVFDVKNEEGQLVATVPFTEALNRSPDEQNRS